MYPQPPQPPRRSRRARHSFVFMLLVVATIIASGYFVARKTSAHSSHAQNTNESQELKTIADTANAAKEAAAKATFLASTKSTITNYDGADIGVSMVDIDNNSQIDVGESAVFTAASTAKVLTAILYLHQVEQGNTSLDTTIDGTDAQTLMQKMINVSDNDAWHDLNDYMGHDALQAYADSLGLTSYDATNNYITAHNDAQLLAKLYKGQLINSAHTQLLYSFMQHTSNEDLIPANLPSDATVYHKYGELDGELHDTSIIIYKGHHIALSVYTKGVDLSDYAARTTVFHDIAAAAITYMSTK
ncbi:MAG: serine hydrolase [Candidatus Saccharibacteria bacterium]